MYDEAFAIYKKIGDNVSAVTVLLDHLGSTTQACEYAEKINQPEVWTKLGKA